MIPGGSPRKQRRRQLKHLRHLVRDEYLPRKQKYRQYHEWFGDRNSFSKTDHDATFMRMKEDPMQNGQLKQGTICKSPPNHNSFSITKLINGPLTSELSFLS
ncbi:hypothetical protein [Lentilactobacillus kisonensis]|uniref:hypothetical protein n=1 Tax=Lentilactobacillus kisonensis TaxID=481722 RepID=UPI000A74B527|nr:hypothetical protein [Lentilactobacillus kisonensis]